MKVAIALFSLFAVASAIYLPPYYPGYYPVPYDYEDISAASLGGAKVGLYGKHHGYPRYPGFPGYPHHRGYSEVSAASLGGAKVGLYGRERY